MGPHAVPRCGGRDDRKIECLRGLREADDVMLELSNRVVAHSAQEADLVIDEDKRGVFGCERLVRVGWVGHGILPGKMLAAAAGATPRIPEGDAHPNGEICRSLVQLSENR